MNENTTKKTNTHEKIPSRCHKIPVTAALATNVLNSTVSGLKVGRALNPAAPPSLLRCQVGGNQDPPVVAAAAAAAIVTLFAIGAFNLLKTRNPSLILALISLRWPSPSPEGSYCAIDC